MNQLRVLQVCLANSWVQPLLDVLQGQVQMERVLPTAAYRGQYKMTPRVADLYREPIERFRPHIIHVHGTENNFGQLQHFFPQIPVVVSIQGIYEAYLPYATAGLTADDMRPHRTLKNILGRGGLRTMERTFLHGIEAYERDIFQTCRYYFCRTDWDRQWVETHSPSPHIYQGEELLRPAFYQRAGQWSPDRCRPHSIFMPAGYNPIKGLHYALRATAALKKTWPDVHLRVPSIPPYMLQRGPLKHRLLGEEYIGYILHLVRELDLTDNVTFLPRLTAEQMADEMLQAAVFLSPTVIDNSPNSVGEAMMLGMPVVSTPVGGIPSFLTDGSNALLAPPEGLADAVSSVFTHPSLARDIASAAHHTALRRHDPTATAQQYINAYHDIAKRC